MRLLLTSAGIKNASIRGALIDLLGKPIAESSALCIPTAMYGHPMVGHGERSWQFISGRSDNPMCELGWKSLGVLELTALPSIDEDRWVPLVRETDVLLVAGGDALYLSHWMRQSGLADLLPSLRETVWVGLSAGSMVMTPRIGEDFVGWRPPTGGDETLGIVDFSIFPHVDHEDLPGNSMAEAERWAAGIPNRAYAIDDQTAIKVVDGTVEVVSEGHWKLLTPGSGQLVLREIEDRDLGVLFEHARDRDAIRMAAFTSPEADDRTTFERRWTRLRSDGATTNRVIEIDDRVVGHIASFDLEDQREITYWIGREDWGRGIATGALEEFLQLETTRPLYARAASDNAASIRVLTKCGFLVVGEGREFAHGRNEETDEVVLRLDA